MISSFSFNVLLKSLGQFGFATAKLATFITSIKIKKVVDVVQVHHLKLFVNCSTQLSEFMPVVVIFGCFV